MAAKKSARSAKANKQLLKSVTVQLNPAQPAAAHVAGKVLEVIARAGNAGQLPLVEFIGKQLVAAMPALTAAYQPLFKLYNDSKRWPELEQLCRDCLQQAPREIPALVNLSIALRMRQTHSEAIDCLQRALTLEPNSAALYNHLGVSQKESGQLPQALASFNRAIALKPGQSKPYWNRADLYRDINDDELAAISLRAASDKASPAARARFYYALARGFEHRGDYTNSFQSLRRGAEIKRGLLDYDHPKEMAELARIAEVFDQQTSNIAITDDSGGVDGGVSNSGCTPIFICGLPRSGTTLLEQIISSHPDINAGDELFELPKAAAQLLQRKRIDKAYPEWAPDLDDSDWQAIGDDYLVRTAYLQGGKFFSDKMLLNYKSVGVIARALPQAKIINCLRQPLDNIIGCYKQLFGDGLRFTYDLDELTDTVIAYRQLMQHWHHVLPGRILDVHYEDVVQDQEQTTRRVLDFIGADWEPRCLNFHHNDRPVLTASSIQIRQPLYHSGLQNWQHYRDELSPLTARLQDYL